MRQPSSSTGARAAEGALASLRKARPAAGCQDLHTKVCLCACIYTYMYMQIHGYRQIDIDTNVDIDVDVVTDGLNR